MLNIDKDVSKVYVNAELPFRTPPLLVGKSFIGFDFTTAEALNFFFLPDDDAAYMWCARNAEFPFKALTQNETWNGDGGGFTSKLSKLDLPLTVLAILPFRGMPESPGKQQFHIVRYEFHEYL